MMRALWCMVLVGLVSLGPVLSFPAACEGCEGCCETCTCCCGDEGEGGVCCCCSKDERVPVTPAQARAGVPQVWLLPIRVEPMARVALKSWDAGWLMPVRAGRTMGARLAMLCVWRT